ncbi:hypothetical protein BDF20DRAFT_1002337 [Mycotypha africana]|uniref:uncharacterized protein n=1 Tax=Mycotypha africana TaxID=64632 RepID=UPI002301460F|nr:uncharacterized protein BDF20DRAFT_1002337 [Mycotypha africana]KAI8973346.1 hypothetical protein BDF20DRAFT_1002337 [Mycotypha africana]
MRICNAALLLVEKFSPASTEGAIGDSDTTNNRVIDVSETTSSDATDSRTNDNATVNQDKTNAADTHDNDNTISPFDLNPYIDSSGDVGDGPGLFRSKNITRLFEDYQSIVQSLHQHSPIAKKVFSDELLDDLAESMVSESMNYNLNLSEQQYMAMAKFISQLSLSKATRENAFIELSLMSASMNYNERRLVRGLTNLIQKLPKLPLKDNSTISESELWNTYFDPLLSCLICDPEKLVHLRWTNATPSEGGKLRPDAVISKRQQLEYEGSVGYGEAKVIQGSSSRYSLCMDTLRLAIFSKNAIDVNKLEGALAFQIYVMVFMPLRIANLHFPESLEDLPSFISLKNITLLLAVNDVFWRLCKKSDKAVTITNRYKETVDLEGLIGASQDYTRTCAMRYGQ